MNASPLRRLLVLASLTAAGVPLAAHGQAGLLTDIKTVTTQGPTPADSPITPRLFLDSGAQQRAPLGTPIWFIVDLDRNGLPAESLGNAIFPSQFLGADDHVILRDAVDGDQPGSVLGQFRRIGVNIDIPAGQTAESVLAGNIYAVLWSSSAVTTTPIVGTSFGLLNLGVNARPAIGNPFWAIDENIIAASFAVVPEVDAAAFAGLALMGWFAARRAARPRTP